MAEENEQFANKDEQIGFHKGALATLAKEREEFSRILGIVEQIMQMHLGALKELGVDLEQLSAAAQGNKSAAPPTKKKPIEDIL